MSATAIDFIGENTAPVIIVDRRRVKNSNT